MGIQEEGDKHSFKHREEKRERPDTHDDRLHVKELYIVTSRFFFKFFFSLPLVEAPDRKVTDGQSTRFAT